MLSKAEKAKEYGKQSRLIHGDWRQSAIDYSRAMVPPVSSSATYGMDTSVFGGKRPLDFLMELEDLTRLPFYIYTRFDDPTNSLLEDRIALAEGGETALVFASGMAAITAALLTNFSAGDEVLYHRSVYGNTHSVMTKWLPRFGVKTTALDFNADEALSEAITEKTMIVYFETPVNPLIDLVDIQKVRNIVDDAEKRLGRPSQIQIILDNTFATPCCQRPLEQGANMVVCSLTKSIGGFGVDLGGAIVGSKENRAAYVMYREEMGAVLSPKAAWNMLTFGFPTLEIRMKAMQENAVKVAQFLEKHPKVRRVNYPGLESHPQHEIARRQMRDFNGDFAPGSLLYFELDTDDENAAERFTVHASDKSYCISLAVSFGQPKTLLENPYNMTHLLVSEEEKKSMGITRTGMRLSVGLEKPEDIIRDLNDCLDEL